MMENWKNRHQLRGFLVVLTFGVASLSADSYLSEVALFEDSPAFYTVVDDPFEPLNRAVFRFNDRVYTYVMDPLTVVYERLTSAPIRTAVLNFFDHLKYPVRLSGNLLQGRFSSGWLETERFVLNTTVGLLGVLDPAVTIDRYAGLSNEDVGQALAHWGLPRGPYLVLPLWGPATARDFFGLMGDRVVNPTQSPFSAIDHWQWQAQTTLSSAEVIARFGGRYSKMKAAQIDAYGALKSGFIQYREAAIRD